MERRRFAGSVLPPVASLLLLGVALGLAAARPAAAQSSSREGAPLFLVDEATTVDDVHFDFRSTQTFAPDRLAAEVATEGPTFFDKVKRVLPLVDMAPHPFVPIELQRDVARLRTFYRNHGFLQPRISYEAKTTLDTAANEIDVGFSIEEGPPLIIQDVTFYGPDSTDYAIRQFESKAARERWADLRDSNSFRIGERYTDYTRTGIVETVLRGLKNRGYPFVRAGSDVQVDSTANTVDIRFFVDAGPRARIDDIHVRGNESVGREVVLRELPFQKGDWFSADALARGQRELFNLQLFRVALAEVPPTPAEGRRRPRDTLAAAASRTLADTQSRDTLAAAPRTPTDTQPRDSTVTVRYQVREASLRYLTAEGGYSRGLGVTGKGSWTHRNFLGDARELSVGLVANTGFLGRPGAAPVYAERLFRANASLRQPFLFVTRLSGVASVFAEFQSNPQLGVSDRFLDTNAGEVGLSGTAIYEFMPFRTASLQYELARALQFRVDTTAAAPVDTVDTGPAPIPGGGRGSVRERDLFNKSILSVNAKLGRADDYVSPTRGFLVRPFLGAGLNVPFQSGTEYLKAGVEVTGYQPLSGWLGEGIADGFSLAGRLQGGSVWPYGRSRRVLNRGGRAEPSSSSTAFSVYENRFDPVFYYAGGPNDVRGWIKRLAGPKVARRVVYNRGSDNEREEYLYEAVGGRSKVAFSAELRMPFPGLGENWGTAAFLDGGQVWGANGPLPDDEAPDDFSISNVRYGAGAGVRYQTPVGYLRLDLALKVNPDFEDLRVPKAVYRYNQCRARTLPTVSCDVPGADDWRRLRLHLSIGQSF